MTTERENTPKTKQEDTTMNAKTQAQINRMKEQTIGGYIQAIYPFDDPVALVG